MERDRSSNSDSVHDVQTRQGAYLQPGDLVELMGETVCVVYVHSCGRDLPGMSTIAYVDHDAQRKVDLINDDTVFELRDLVSAEPGPIQGARAALVRLEAEET